MVGACVYEVKSYHPLWTLMMWELTFYVISKYKFALNVMGACVYKYLLNI